MKKLTLTDWPAGLMWRNHFRRNLLEELEAGERDEWGPGEREILGPSLAQFQLGESSDGRHLLRYARRFGDASGDSWLGEAMALFIQEENRHSHWLGEFLKAQGYPPLRAHWADAVFRMVRKLLGFGLMTAVLVCAEIVAVPYYTAVRTMTGSNWLRAICTRLLDDEAIHLRFQAANLGAVWRRWKLTRVWGGCHNALMAMICLVVWREHGEVLRRGGYTRLTFLKRCLDLLEEVHAGAMAARREDWPVRVPAAVR
ncbi:MAG: hypothetical protein ACKV2U_30320 [Bryobacteraceae bacterium]